MSEENITQEKLRTYQDEAIRCLYSLISSKPSSELEVKDNVVKVQAAALLLNVELPPTAEEIQTHLAAAMEQERQRITG